ncbi:MAG: asparagine synthase C-terminal domain-containing protein [Desulfobacterota bacterium]|nr:asparagine synthase C-terminal domain-containing protein [Thermodesulfobacteriota bacterium]
MKKRIRALIEESVAKNLADALLLSGGLDTSILALVLKRLNVECHSVSVSLEGKGEDIEYLMKLKEFLHIDPLVVFVTVEEAISAIPEVIRILKSFDPAIPNDLVLYFGMKKLKEEGMMSVMTGDGADEIFAGYSYMAKIDDLNSYILKMLKGIRFNSDPIGQHFGIEVKKPYLSQEIKSFAGKIPRSLRIRDGWGKWILRKAYEEFLPKDLVYQSKRPLEVGSGMSYVRDFLSSKISDEEFYEKEKLYGMKFYGKDHLYYFEIYKEVCGIIPPPNEDEISCPNCGGGKRSSHCRICGYSERII